MVDTLRSTFNLGLPAIPETKDPTLFAELVKVYNALRLLAQGTDTYTDEGTLVPAINKLQTDADRSVDNSAELYELRKKYYRYSVPKFAVTGDLSTLKFAMNGSTPRGPVTMTTMTLTPISTGYTGTAEGGFADQAARDAMVTDLNNVITAVSQIRATLKSFGFMV